MSATLPGSPSAGTDTADQMPGAWLRAEPHAGHLIWLELPGAVLKALTSSPRIQLLTAKTIVEA